MEEKHEPKARELSYEERVFQELKELYIENTEMKLILIRNDIKFDLETLKRSR